MTSAKGQTASKKEEKNRTDRGHKTQLTLSSAPLPSITSPNFQGETLDLFLCARAKLDLSRHQSLDPSSRPTLPRLETLLAPKVERVSAPITRRPKFASDFFPSSGVVRKSGQRWRMWTAGLRSEGEKNRPGSHLVITQFSAFRSVRFSKHETPTQQSSVYALLRPEKEKKTSAKGIRNLAHFGGIAQDVTADDGR